MGRRLEVREQTRCNTISMRGCGGEEGGRVLICTGRGSESNTSVVQLGCSDFARTG